MNNIPLPALAAPIVVKARRDPRRVNGSYVDAEYVLQFSEDAYAEFSLEGEIFEICPGDMLLMAPYLAHSLRTSKVDKQGFSIVHFLLPGPSLAHFPTAIRLEEEARFSVSAAFDRLLAAGIRENPRKQWIRSGTVMEMLGEFATAQSVVSRICETSGGATNLRRVLAKLHTIPIGAWTVETMRAESGLSSSHFGHIFRQFTGLRPINYINRARVQRARELLMEGRMNCTEIAEHVGYETVHAFSKAFKKEARESPTCWVRRVLG